MISAVGQGLEGFPGGLLDVALRCREGGLGIPFPDGTDLSVESLQSVTVFGRKRAGKLMPGWKAVRSDQDIYTAIAAIVSLRHVPAEEGRGGVH